MPFLGMELCGCFLFGVCWTSWSVSLWGFVFIFWPNLGCFQPLFLHKFFLHHTLFSVSGYPRTWILDILLLYHRCLKFCSCLFLLLKLNNFNYFQSTLFSIVLIFLLFLTSKSFYFNYFIFSVLKLRFSSSHLVFLCQDFLSFNLFPECAPLFFVIALKSDNSNISAILTLSFFNCLFPWKLRFPLLSHMPSNIHYILDILNIMRFWFLE